MARSGRFSGRDASEKGEIAAARARRWAGADRPEGHDGRWLRNCHRDRAALSLRDRDQRHFGKAEIEAAADRADPAARAESSACVPAIAGTAGNETDRYENAGYRIRRPAARPGPASACNREWHRGSWVRAGARADARHKLACRDEIAAGEQGHVVPLADQFLGEIVRRFARSRRRFSEERFRSGVQFGRYASDWPPGVNSQRKDRFGCRSQRFAAQ